MDKKVQTRAIIENVEPTVNCGTFPICRVTDEIVIVTADVFGDGHDIVQAEVLYKHERERNWHTARMNELDNDRWSAPFTVEKQGKYEFKIHAWVDHPLNWLHGIERKIEDGQYVFSDLQDGVQYVKETAKKTEETSDKEFLKQGAETLNNEDEYDQAVKLARSERLEFLFHKYPLKKLVAESDLFSIYVDRKKARFSTWYEFFPRSAAETEGRHGTFKDCERLIPRVADMGFDTLYFPPVHPIGEVNRKGKNNTEQAQDGDEGSPWGIGSKHGGHKSIHPELGTLEDFKNLIEVGKNHNIEIAMDFALQCAPDHPYVTSNPEWFRWKPDGTVQYAENPPKKYQDILPIYFESDNWKSLWDELLSIAMYWIEQGIRIFRVDNPHTKPFRFWGWLIKKVKKKYPDVIFLSEAFTKPKVMQQLAKQGFTQSYTYFTWRNNKHELQEYMHELTQTKMKEYFRPNFWPNTPDINPWELQGGNQATYLYRHFLAATLSSNYGMYGPVYEYMVSEAVPGKEEYKNSEKYEVRHWDWTVENKLTHLISKINHIRSDHPALQQTKNIHFCETHNDQLMAFYKWDQQKTDHILCVVSLDPYHRQSGAVEVPRHLFEIEHYHPVYVKDLITNIGYEWNDQSCYVELGPQMPYHLFNVSW